MLKHLQAPWLRYAGLTLLTLAGGCSQPVRQASTATAPKAVTTNVPNRLADVPTQQAYWRASSRLGYGPSPAVPPPLPESPQGVQSWAIAQIDAAKSASQLPIVIPAGIPDPLRGFNAPLPELLKDFAAERQARKQADEAGKKEKQKFADPGMAPAAKEPPPAELLEFSRDMARGAATWRVMACSSSEVENPMLARMTEFWFNHLNVFAGKGAVRPFVGHYVVNAIRPHALGKFEDLLLASARHPAMLLYLDQAQSVAPNARPLVGSKRGLNENYARELLELHTLGAQGGYTQSDVHELARVLTGWGVKLVGGGGFEFTERLHDKGTKVVLGRTFRDNGVQEGEAAIRMLARHPATARRVALRLARFFVADNPPPALVDQLAQRFLDTQGDIAQVMRVLLASPEFWRTDQTLFKTPLDYACSILTANGGVRDRRDVELTLSFLAGAGQPLHGWQTPDGYQTDAATWLAPEALTRRADYAVAMGQRTADPAFVLSWLQAASRSRLSSEPLRQQAGLAMAAPEFMTK